MYTLLFIVELIEFNIFCLIWDCVMLSNSIISNTARFPNAVNSFSQKVVVVNVEEAGAKKSASSKRGFFWEQVIA